MGYDIKVGKDITLRAPGRENGRKLCRNLGEEYSLEASAGGYWHRAILKGHTGRIHSGAGFMAI